MDTPTPLSLPAQDLRGMLDIILNSVIFDFGFLSPQEVILLRRVATLLGLDPWLATPAKLRHTYPHPYKPWKQSLRQTRVPIYHNCEACGAEPHAPCHQDQAQEQAS